MKKELPLFKVDDMIGFDQELFDDWWMNKGGCGAVVACDCCIYFKKYMGISSVFGSDTDNITEDCYERFAMKMKPFLSPRISGINKPEIFADGFADYLESMGETRIKMDVLLSSCPYEELLAEVKRLIDCDLPVPMLILRHKNPLLEDFVWHWFWLAGYEEFDGTCMVKAISYGTYRWFSLYDMWNSGHAEKGGIIRFKPIEGNGVNER
ncbi:MAG: hypothetical protein IJR59_06280 [Firmicutes bacterium]|nr:hypothetical protein [Bacillota bacterium]